MEEGSGLPRNLSSRFQVDRVNYESQDTPDRPITVVHQASCEDKGLKSVEEGNVGLAAGKVGLQHGHVHFSVDDSESDHDRHNSSSHGYSTHNVKSFRNVETMERVPHIDHYRNIMSIEGAIATRPTLAQLHEESPDDTELKDTVHDQTAQENALEEFRLSSSENNTHVVSSQGAPTKFGWFQGVFVRCFLNILGVMLYLRISWVAGQAGVLLGSLIVILSSVVTTLTAISMCAITTNGDIKGGGCYFMISRSLGPEFGGSIGIIFAFANAVGAAMYVVGFAETVRDIMKEYGVMIIDGDMNDIRLIGIVTACVLMGIVFIGTGFEAKMQIGLLGILLISIVNYVIGLMIPTKDWQNARGITGLSITTISENIVPGFRDGENFFSVFAVFFPAATGIMAGANISGDLADPSEAIPKGTLSAIFITTIIYVSVVWTTGASCIRDASGQLIDSFTGINGTQIITQFAPCGVGNNSCEYGLMNYFQVMDNSSAWGPLITAGVFAATLSSALASLVSAPKVFQAVCKDRLFPYFYYFAKGYGSGDDPRRAYLLGFLIALLIVLIGDLNAIAPLISNFFLASYALINYACFDASFAESPGFRPAFKYYNMWVSLFAALLCIGVMFVISWWTALVTFAFILCFYTFLHHKKPDVNWGSSTQAHSYKNALQAMVKLSQTEEHVKNYRPQLLVLAGNPTARPSLVDFASNLTRDTSLMVCGHVIHQKPSDKTLNSLGKLRTNMTHWLAKKKIKAFYCPVANEDVRKGVQSLLQLAGLGRLKPNIVLMGFKNNWLKSTQQQLIDYCGIIHDSFDSNLGVCVLRLAQGLDYSEMMREHNIGELCTLKFNEPNSSIDVGTLESSRDRSVLKPKESAVFIRDPDEIRVTLLPDNTNTNIKNTSNNVSAAESFSSFAEKFQAEVENENETREKQTLRRESQGVDSPSKLFRQRQMSNVQKEVLGAINQFQRRLKKAVIDVWWLFDDGGLTLLIPHILKSHKSYLEGAKMRIFTVSSTRSQLEQEQRSMAALLSKFRIEYTDVFVIPDIAKKPNANTIAEFEKLIEPLVNCEKPLISEIDLQTMKDKTHRQLRTKELLNQHSTDASLVVLTLPVPRKTSVPSALYMAWLETLTCNLPPVLLCRGNQNSVLTFYS